MRLVGVYAVVDVFGEGLCLRRGDHHGPRQLRLRHPNGEEVVYLWVWYGMAAVRLSPTSQISYFILSQ